MSPNATAAARATFQQLDETMDTFAHLLTSIAALVGALAWPATLLAIILVFRVELKSALARVGTTLDRVTKASVAGLVVELERIADAEVERGIDKDGKITLRQGESAVRIAVEARDVSLDDLIRELDRLCLEYDSLRRTLPSGRDRTRAMTRVVIKMRSLAPSLIGFLDAYKGSGSAGSRLAAIAMMQMEPRDADIDWLKGRFLSEQPFVFYHAALALQNVADNCDTTESRRRLRTVALQTIATVKSFSGIPDRSTIDVLEALISSLPQE